jgi:hypothetical protein
MLELRDCILEVSDASVTTFSTLGHGRDEHRLLSLHVIDSALVRVVVRLVVRRRRRRRSAVEGGGGKWAERKIRSAQVVADFV